MNNKGQLNKLDTFETLKRNAKLNNVQNWTTSKSESAEHNDVMLLQGKSIESHSIANPIRKKPKVFQEKTYFPSLDKKKSKILWENQGVVSNTGGMAGKGINLVTSTHRYNNDITSMLQHPKRGTNREH